MNPLIHRRASLGLAIHGPFSRNRRRRSIRNAVPGLIAGALVIALATFGFFLFR